jgi:hypothetical protein
LDDINATRVSTEPSPDAAASTSSTPQEQSPPSDQLADLGERILAELDAARTISMLARWLAHHVAALIQAADEARATSAPDADARAAEARVAILQLWQHRSDWPAGWPPPRAAHMARILEKLPDSSIPPWQPATPLTRIHERHHDLLALLVAIVTSDGDDVEQGWLKAFGGLLTPDETAMLTLAATAEQRMSRHFNWQEPAGHEPGTEGDVDDTEPARERTPQQVLGEMADAYRQAVFDLLADSNRRSDGSGPGPDLSHRADAAQGPAELDAEDASQ